jgi:ribosomal protein S6
MLTVPEITGDEAKNIETTLDKTVKAGSGSVISFERWGKYKLTHEINKNEYGVFFLTRFEAPEKSTLIHDLKTLFKVRFDGIVMRDMISVLDPKQPLTYHRPRSLEEAPAREAESFAKEKVSNYFAADDRDETDEE